jgi:pimeloyl-ACP methyl ester carboxylesterase
MPNTKLEYKISSNGIPYVKWGSGKKTMLIFAGGPGNSLPKGFGFRMMVGKLDSLTGDYTMYMAMRKQGLKPGATTRDLSDDYAEMVKNDFNGYVDTVIGMSFGGMTVQYFAADHPECFKHAVIALAAYRMSEQGRKLDMDFARLVAIGKKREAACKMMGTLGKKGIGGVFVKAMAWLFGGTMFKGEYAAFNSDIIIEAEAENTHNAREALGRINVPVLIVGGTADYYFPEENMRETHRLIKNSTLKLYEGKGHIDTLSDKRFVRDLREFIG